MKMVNLKLFGAFEVTVTDVPVTDFRSDKIRGLLAYLAMSPGIPHRREVLAGLFWGEWPDDVAKSNLRKSLHRLRTTLDSVQKGFSDQLLHVTPQTVQLNENTITLDVHAFLGASERVEAHRHPQLHHCQACLDALQSAAALYRGDFFAGFSIGDAPAFEEWLAMQREILQQRVLLYLHNLTEASERRGAYEIAQAYARQQLKLEPWREEAHRQLMRAFALGGDRNKALEAYETYRKVLSDELGVDPALESRQLHAQILMEEELVPDEVNQAAGMVNFPPQPTPFFGRLAEIERMAAQVVDPNCRLMTIVGPGGIGKTRASIRLVEQLVSENAPFFNGYYFVPLDSVHSASQLAYAIAECLDLSFYNTSSIRQQLVDFLRSKQVLLVMDNFEQLLVPTEAGESVDLIVEIINQCPDVGFVVTSREALSIRQEWTYVLEGLAYPKAEDEISQMELCRDERFTAVQFFIRTALRINPQFSPDQEQCKHIIQICRMLDGSPLALELAAQWTRSYDLAGIAREIEQGIDFLQANYRDIPARHRSIRAVMEQSWNLLSPDQRQAFARLSIFAGDFNRSVAGEAAKVPSFRLAELVEKSLIQMSVSGRYHLHDLVKHFGMEKLADEIGSSEVETIILQHQVYFLQYLSSREAALYGSQMVDVLPEIRQVFPDIRKAWDGALEEGNYAGIHSVLRSLHRYWIASGLYEEGAVVFESAVIQIKGRPLDEEDSDYVLRTRTLASLMLFHHETLFYTDFLDHVHLPDAERLCMELNDPALTARLSQAMSRQHIRSGRLEEASRNIEQALDHARLSGDQHLIGQVMFSNAKLLWSQGKIEEGLEMMLEVVRSFQAFGDDLLAADCMGNIGLAYFRLSDFENALIYHHGELEIARRIRNRFSQSKSMNNIGIVYHQRGDVSKAMEYYKPVIDMDRQFGSRMGLAKRLTNMGLANFHAGNYPEGMQAMQEALELFTKLEHKVGMGINYSNLGLMYASMGDVEEALSHLEQAVELDGSLGNEEGVSRHYNGMATVYIQMEDYPKAHELLDASLEIHSRQKMHKQHAEVLLQKTDLLLRQGDDENARQYAAKGAELIQEVGHLEMDVTAQILIARCDWAAGKRDDTIRLLTALHQSHPADHQKAEITYWLWKMTGETPYQQEAQNSFIHLLSQTPKYDYRIRLEELTEVG